jgi:tetratricopeptide (TPR) repeat protein
LAAIKSAAVFFLQALGDSQHAIELGQQAVELSATAENYAMLATVYDAAGENQKAIETLERAVQLAPANASYQQALALMRENDTLEKIDN